MLFVVDKYYLDWLVLSEKLVQICGIFNFHSGVEEDFFLVFQGIFQFFLVGHPVVSQIWRSWHMLAGCPGNINRLYMPIAKMSDSGTLLPVPYRPCALLYPCSHVSCVMCPVPYTLCQLYPVCARCTLPCDLLCSLYHYPVPCTLYPVFTKLT